MIFVAAQKPVIESMSEAEVILRLAFWLLSQDGAGPHADVAIDGAHVSIAAHEASGRWIEERTVFPIGQFLADTKCIHRNNDSTDWHGDYDWNNSSITIKSVHGFDVQVALHGRLVKVECKGGPISPKSTKSVNAILASAIGQAICADLVTDSDEVWVAVPDSPGFEAVGRRITNRRGFAGTGIRIALVGRTGVRILN